MSSTWYRVQSAGCRVAIATVLIVLPRVLPGQSAAELEQRVHRLERRAAELSAKVDSAAAADRARWADSLVAIRDGGFQILAPRDLAEDSRKAARLAATTLAATFGDSIVQLIRNERFLVFPEAVVDSARSELRSLRGLGIPVLAPRGDRVRLLAVNLMDRINQTVWQRFDPALREWLAAPLAPTLNPDRIPGSSYIDLVTAASPPSGACFRGSMEGCTQALGLERPTDPAVAWYSDAGRRALAGRLSTLLRTGTSTGQFASCVHGRSDPDCRALLARVSNVIPPPLTPQTRATFLRLALRRGGPEAFTRLLQSPADSIDRRISHAAGQSRAVLLQDWHDQVLAAKPPPTTLTLPQAWTTMMWAGVLMLLSLRSSRWR